MARHNIYRICAYTFNTITFITLIVLFILFEGIMSPFNRGFFCNDESIQKPYVAKQTVPVAMLTGLAVGVVLIVVSWQIFFPVCYSTHLLFHSNFYFIILLNYQKEFLHYCIFFCIWLLNVSTWMRRPGITMLCIALYSLAF